MLVKRAGGDVVVVEVFDAADADIVVVVVVRGDEIAGALELKKKRREAAAKTLLATRNTGRRRWFAERADGGRGVAVIGRISGWNQSRDKTKKMRRNFFPCFLFLIFFC